MTANLALAEARKQARLSQDGLARKVRDAGRRLGTQNGCSRGTIARWEAGEAIPQPAMLAALEEALGADAEALGFGEVPVSWLPPPGFSAEVLSGAWVTAYQFPHDGKQLHHADLAHITASETHVRAVNHPPAPRTEGRDAAPFRNEVETELASRHLVGHWKNVSDTRYFGMVHLAVLPGESVLDGYFTGFASDVAVSAMSEKIGYARCSTDKQDLTAQREALADLGVTRDRIYLNHGLTGTNRARPGLDQALAAVRAGDTLVATKLDRAFRSVPDARDIISGLADRGVLFQLGASIYDWADPMSKMFLQMLAVFAEFDVDLIRMRTREGMAVAKANGKLNGKPPKLSAAQTAHLVDLHATGDYTMAELAELFSVSRPTINRTLQRAGAITGHTS